MARHSSAAAAVPARPLEPGRGQRGERSPRGRRGRAAQAHRTARPQGVARLAVTVVLVSAVLLLLGIRQAAITAVGYEIDRTKRELAEAQAALERLEAELARLATPGRVEEGALAMGMREAAEVRVASVDQLAAAPSVTPQGDRAVVQLPPVRDPEAPAALTIQPPSLAETAGELLSGWLSGKRAEAESLN